MPKTKTIGNPKLWKRLYLYSLLFFAILLPFQPKWLPLTLGMMVFGLFWLLSGGFQNKLDHLSKNLTAGLFFLYYLWVVIGAFYTTLPAEAEKDVVLKLPFVVWPLALGSLFLFSSKNLQYLLRWFILASAISILFCFTMALGDFLNNGDVREFFFTRLVNYKVLPPHYLGMYLSFSYGCLLYQGLRKKYFFSRSTDVLLMIIMAVGILFISVRMQYIVFLLINGWIFFSFLYQKSGFLKASLSLLVLILIFGSLAWVFPGSKRRIKDTYNEIVSFEREVNQKQTNHRKFLWLHGWEVVREHLWIGTGTGASDQALQLKLQNNDHKFWDGQDVYYLRDRNYNFHNTYLQQWATHGIVGLLILLLAMLVPFWRTHDFKGRLFIVICGLSFLTESMLERQAGVLFFSFFYCLLFVVKTIDENQKSQQAIE